MSKYTELITTYHTTKPLFFDPMDALVTKITNAPTANLSLKIVAKRDVGVGAN